MMPDAMMPDVTSIGDVNIDLITKIKGFPEKDRQTVVEDYSMRIGGCAANFAASCADLGLNTRLICKIGDDVFKNFILDNLNFDVRYSSGGKNGITQAFSFEDGKRSFVTYRGTNKEFKFEDINLKDIEGKYAHITSYFLTGIGAKTGEILRHCRSRGIKTSFDTGWDPFGWNNIPEILEALKHVDIFFPNMDEARKISGKKEVKEILKFLLEYAEIIALKNGSKGCYIASSDEVHSIKPYKVNVSDSVGAGDAFDAAFIYAHSKGLGLKEAGEFANAAGAVKCRLGRNPSVEEVNMLSGI